MKILVVNTLYHPTLFGGAERVVQSLAEGMLEAGHQPTVVTLGTEPGVRSDVVGGVPVHYVGLRNLYWPFPADQRVGFVKPVWHAIDTRNPAMGRALARLIDVERPDVVHTHNLMGFSTGAWAVAARRRVPIVHTLHDYYLLCPKSSMFADGENCASQHLSCAIFSRPRVRASAHVGAVLGVSRFVLDRHLAFGAFPHAVLRDVAYNPYDAPSPPPMPAPRPVLRVGYLGRLDPSKGIEHLLDACAALPAGGWELHVAGAGPADYELALRARARGRPVQFVGHVHTESFLPSIDVLVVPSLWNEPLGMVAVEAFAAGVPVIASLRGGIPELVTERTGWLFDPAEPAELTAILSRLIDDPQRARERREACLTRARDFARPRVVAQYERAYAAVTERRL